MLFRSVAAVGPAMMKVAGQAYDGVRLHPFCTRRYLEDTVIPTLENALASVGRQRKRFEISGGGFIATGADDEAVAKMFEWVRIRIGFYGSTRAYWPVLEAHDLEELGLKLNQMSRNNQWDQMAQEVTDDIVHLFAAVGRTTRLPRRLEDVSEVFRMLFTTVRHRSCVVDCLPTSFRTFNVFHRPLLVSPIRKASVGRYEQAVTEFFGYSSDQESRAHLRRSPCRDHDLAVSRSVQ